MRDADGKLRLSFKQHDARGLVWGYCLRSAAPRSLHDGPAPAASVDEPVWYHFNLADGRARAWLSEESGLPAEAVDLLLDPLRRVRLQQQGGAVIGILEDLHHDFHGDPEGFGELRFYVDETRVISGRRHPLKSVDVLHRALEQGTPIDSTASWLDELVEGMTQSFGEAVHALVDEVDELEDEIVAGSNQDERARLASIRRLLVRFRRHVHADRAALGKLRPHGVQAQGTTSPLRLALEHLDSVSQDLDLVHERVRLLQEEVAGLLAEATNRNLYVLSVVTTVLLPATLVTSIWGMNVGGMPWADDPHGFLWTALGVVFTILVSLALLRGTRVL
jgi:zinc transporter